MISDKPPQSDTVVVRKVEDLHADMLDCLRRVGFTVSDSDLVVIKPNLCNFRPSWHGGTVGPETVEAVIAAIRETAHPKIVVVESDHAVGQAGEVFERLGYAEMARRCNVSLVNLTEEKRLTVQLDGHYFKRLEVPEVLLRMTKFVSVAKLKTHVDYKITGILKNQFGLIPRRMKSKYHPFMSQILVDLNTLFKPSLCVIDGVVGMEGEGPSDGAAKQVGVIIVGNNPVATDAVAAQVMGFDPRSIAHLRLAEKAGVGSIDEGVEVVGEAQNHYFAFVPGYSYQMKQLGHMTGRVAEKTSTTLQALSKLLSQSGIGLVVLFRGRYPTTDYGVIVRNDAVRIIRGIFRRMFLVARFAV